MGPASEEELGKWRDGKIAMISSTAPLLEAVLAAAAAAGGSAAGNPGPTDGPPLHRQSLGTCLQPADRPYTRSHSTRENIAGLIMKALLLLVVFSRSSHGRPQIGSTEPEQQSIVSLQSGQQQFMNRLLQQIESNTTTNFVLSPHSIHSVFSQLLQGSGGRTKEELESLLGVRASDSLVEQYRILGQGLAGEGFKQANLLAVANSFKPTIEFRTNLNNGFQSDIREFDFGSNSLGSVQEVRTQTFPNMFFYQSFLHFVFCNLI